MRRGLIISLFLHMVVFFFVFVNITDVLFPKPQVKAIQIKLVTAKNVKKTTKKEEPKKVKTQQSTAPSAPPKPKKKEKPKPQPKPNKPTVVQKQPEKKVSEKKVAQSVKPEPKQPEPQKQEPKVADVPRPPKLDKSKDKKNLIKDDAPQKDATKPVEDDFMKALSFLEELEADQNAMFEGEETDEPTTLNLAEQADLALIKKHIERNWYKTPGTTGEQPVHYRIKLNRDGTLADMKMIQSSGKRSFDKSLERAIRKSVPFPISAEKYDLFKEIDLHWQSS